MTILRTPHEAPWPTIPDFRDKELEAFQEELENYHRNLTAILDETVRAIFDDLSLGYFRLGIVSSAPALADLEEGQGILMDDGATVRRVYYRMNGSLRYANLT